MATKADFDVDMTELGSRIDTNISGNLEGQVTEMTLCPLNREGPNVSHNATNDVELSSSRLPKSKRPGRSYRPAQIEVPRTECHEEDRLRTSSSLASSYSMSGTTLKLSMKEHSNDSSDEIRRISSNSGLTSPRVMPSMTSPRSPRFPRRLTPISRSVSEDTPSTTTSQSGDNHDDDKNNFDGSDDDTVFAWNQKPLPSSSTVFRQVLTDLHDRPTSSLDLQSPGDLMVRRSSLAVTGLLSENIIEEDDAEDPRDLGMDIALETHDNSQANARAQEVKQSTNNANKINEFSTSKKNPSKYVRGGTTRNIRSKPPILYINADDSPSKVLLSPRSCQSGSIARPWSESDSIDYSQRDISTRVLRDRSAAKSRVSSVHLALVEKDCSKNEAEIFQEKTRRKTTGDQPAKYHAAASTKANQGSVPKINMKTAGQISKFIAAAAASLSAPGLNKSQKLLPSSDNLERLPVLDPSGRLLQRRRDESMRMVRQAVDLDTSEETSEVYSWDELRNCRYLRTKKRARDSRRNSLLGFNEI